jgi:two-component system sensor histidine kinase BaeS
MARRQGPWIGKLGLRLTLAFVAVALATIIAGVIVASLTIGGDVNRLVTQQETDVSDATALAAAAAYDHVGWTGAKLTPVIDLVDRAGGSVQVRSPAGRVIRSSPGFATFDWGAERRQPVLVHGLRVGFVTVKFGDAGLGGAAQLFERARWRARMTVAGFAVLIALLVALPLSRRISLPVDNLIKAARRRASGDVDARAGDVRGFGEVRELSQAFDQMADTLGQQDRLRRNLVADVAHELRTPIAVLQAGHEAMLDGVTDPETEHLASLHDEVLRLARMVDDLQRLASAEAAALQLKVVPGDLAEVAATAADSLADSFDAAGVRLVRRLDRVEVRCDPLRMHEVALNLLTNALKFTPAGGNVLLETGLHGQYARLRVRDTGIGIPADELPLVSERFFRGMRSSDVAGSGIGLTIVAELVRAHHGTVDMESEPGHGTEVSITLPLAYSELGPAQPPRKTARDNRSR